MDKEVSINTGNERDCWENLPPETIMARLNVALHETEYQRLATALAAIQKLRRRCLPLLDQSPTTKQIGLLLAIAEKSLTGAIFNVKATQYVLTQGLTNGVPITYKYGKEDPIIDLDAVPVDPKSIFQTESEEDTENSQAA